MLDFIRQMWIPLMLLAVFVMLYVGGIHGTHHGDAKLTEWSLTKAGEVLAAILTVLIPRLAQGKTNGDTSGPNHQPHP